MAKEIRDLSDLILDDHNANLGTERGRYMVESSLREVGAGRSIVVDREGRVIAGNKTLEAWAEMGGAIQVIRTDGRRLVVVQREDLDLSDDAGAARKLALYDNRASEVGLAWDTQALLHSVEAGLDLSALFYGDELDKLIGESQQPGGDEWNDAFGVLPDSDRAPFQQMTFTLHDTQAEVVKRAIAVAQQTGDFAGSPNQNQNGNALHYICEWFLREHTNDGVG